MSMNLVNVKTSTSQEIFFFSPLVFPLLASFLESPQCQLKELTDSDGISWLHPPQLWLWECRLPDCWFDKDGYSAECATRGRTHHDCTQVQFFLFVCLFFLPPAIGTQCFTIYFLPYLSKRDATRCLGESCYFLIYWYCCHRIGRVYIISRFYGPSLVIFLSLWTMKCIQWTVQH